MCCEDTNVLWMTTTPAYCTDVYFRTVRDKATHLDLVDRAYSYHDARHLFLSHDHAVVAGASTCPMMSTKN